MKTITDGTKNRRASEQERALQSRYSTRESFVRNISSTRLLHRLHQGFRHGLAWHAALWATMKKYSISANRIRVINHPHDKATNAVFFMGSIGTWCQTTVGGMSTLIHPLPHISERKGQRCQHVIALYSFLLFFSNRGNIEGTVSSKMLLDVCACTFHICVETNFVDFKEFYALMICVQNKIKTY